MNRSEVNDGGDRRKWSVLPCLDQPPDLICDCAHGGGRDVHAIHVAERLLNITGRDALRVQRDDLILQLICAGLIGFQQR